MVIEKKILPTTGGQKKIEIGFQVCDFGELGESDIASSPLRYYNSCICKCKMAINQVTFGFVVVYTLSTSTLLRTDISDITTLASANAEWPSTIGYQNFKTFAIPMCLVFQCSVCRPQLYLFLI